MNLISSHVRNRKSILRRSHFILGIAKTARGLGTDICVVVWLARREAKIAEYLKAHSVRKLQLAASNNLLPGWLNTDIFLNHRSLVYLDATRRFPFDDDTFDYILSEHMIEHLAYETAQFMLRECLRVLKPGGRVRVATPDLRVILALHGHEKTKLQNNYIEWAIARFMPEVKEYKEVHLINNFFRAWGHQFLYDKGTLHHALSAVGFDEIEFYKPGASADPNLQQIESHGKELNSEDINQFETIVIEGRKQR